MSDVSSKLKLPEAKLAALSRFKSFTGSIMGRGRRPEIVFPPPSWTIEDFNPTSTNWVIPEPEPVPVPVASSAQQTPAEPSPEESVEPLTFAKRLRAMLERLPFTAGIPTSNPTTPPPKVDSSTPPEHSTTGPTQPPSPIPPDIDPGLVRMLSSESVMNGDTGEKGKGKDRPSIWNILSGLRRGDKTEQADVVASAVEGEDGGVMMYAPLEPKSDSQVELAEAKPVAPSADTSGIETKPDVGTEKRVWVPSPTELSVFTTWWGYRLYLPPPVMGKLGAGSVKAAARAAMVTSALKWLLDKIPLMLVPPQFRPAVKMLKNLTPMAGYVGVFIAWSWDRIKMLDKGNGVILTATWLLPVALLPMTWDDDNVQSPGPLPTSSTPSVSGTSISMAQERPIPESTHSDKQETKKKSRF